MTLPTPKTSALILTAKHALTEDQRSRIKEAFRAELPPDVGLIVLDWQLTAEVISSKQ